MIVVALLDDQLITTAYEKNWLKEDPCTYWRIFHVDTRWACINIYRAQAQCILHTPGKGYGYGQIDPLRFHCFGHKNGAEEEWSVNKL